MSSDSEKTIERCLRRKNPSRQSERFNLNTTESPVIKTRYGRTVIPVISKSSQDNLSCKNSPSDSEDESSSSPKSVSEQPSALFDDEVMGSEVFGFRTPRSKNSLMEKVNSSLKKIRVSNSASNRKKSNTPLKKINSETPHKGERKSCNNTPSSVSKEEDIQKEPRTPYSLRKRLRSRIQNQLNEEEDDMFDLTESEYDPSESSSSDSESETEEDCGVFQLPTQEIPTSFITPKRRLPGRKSEFVLRSDEYFSRRKGRKATSNNTLSNAGPRLNASNLNSLLENYTSRHQNAIKLMNKNLAVSYYRWLYSLKIGYNILVYGLGSKKTLLNSFFKCYLSSSLTLVVNGFFPGLTLREIETSLSELIGLKGSLSGDALYSRISNCRKQIFLLIHNIDGEALRTDRIQTFLSMLAALPNVFLIASMDHINTPLLWDQKKLGKFNFIWEDGTTFLPYKKETSFESSLTVHGSGNMALAALKNVMKSLTNNQRRVFSILMDHHINTNGKSNGMSFSELYHCCRADFIISSDLALRTVLTEFFDHELVKWKKETDLLKVTLDISTLKVYKSELSNENE